ncbi:hypothetical protein SSAG_06489 [Streptomyces sp. Mg1]|nr:hypothetical protein SSAG_06489 [Streptomyces sp. Mg1]
MPDPGSSPLQSSLPAAAARFGTHGHGSGIEAFGGGPPVPPVLPAAIADPGVLTRPPDLETSP